MSDKFSTILHVIRGILDTYLNISTKIIAVEDTIKKMLRNTMMFIIFVVIALFSVWFISLGLLFLYLISSPPHFSMFQAGSIILVINLFILMTLMIWRAFKKRRAIIVQKTTNVMLYNYLLEVINAILDRHKNNS